MPYHIELMSLGEDIYPLLERSAAELNRVQTQFSFFLTPSSQRQSGIEFQLQEYATSDIWTFLRNQKNRFGGRRPYIIGFITKPLRSSRLQNLFGSHRADEGLAVVTMFNAGQYVKEEARYCRYYLVRYSLSFVNPLIKAHSDDARKDCYFHLKINRPDIRASMDSGLLCPDCTKQLDNPPEGGTANRLSDEEREALRRMRQFVSGELPHAIVMKGGGVKGLAFAGALLELEKHFWFDRHVGTSAGAIAAVLLAASYTPTQLRDFLLEKDFRDFRDAPAWKIPINLFFRGGCHPGETFQSWITELLAKKLAMLAEVAMKDLKGALIYACRWGPGTIIFDSMGDRKQTTAAFAVRCSMSIPLFFIPMLVDGRRAFDGGLRTNFPLGRFMADHPHSPFIALYLGKPDNRNRRWLGSELLDIVLEGEDRETVDRNRHNVVVIDTSPIGTVDFSLTATEKQFLLQVGKSAALRFLLDRKLDYGPAQQELTTALRESDAGRIAVLQIRNRRQARRVFWFLCFVWIFIVWISWFILF